jgi:hypothetical protein
MYQRGQMDLLAEVPLFAVCTRHGLRDIAKLGTPVQVPSGTILTEEQSPGSEIFVLLEGVAACTVWSSTQEDLTSGD